MKVSCVAVAAFVLFGFPAVAGEKHDGRIIDIGAGSYMRGPIVVRDPRTGKIVLDIPAGAWIGQEHDMAPEKISD